MAILDSIKVGDVVEFIYADKFVEPTVIIGKLIEIRPNEIVVERRKNDLRTMNRHNVFNIARA